MTARPLKWARHNLFSKPFDAMLSLVVIPGTLWLAYSTAKWALFSAQWDIIPASMRVLMIGIFPPDQIWRAWAAVLFLTAMLGGALGCVFKVRLRHAVALAFVCGVATYVVDVDNAINLAYVLASIIAFACTWAATSYLKIPSKWLFAWAGATVIGSLAVMAPPGTELWGGLLLSVLLTMVTAVLTLPLGIFLAFGRRSRYSSVRWICSAYIEVMRSVPLILVVYWIWILMPVLTPQFKLADVVRGMIGFSAFYSAYVAEYVRSGLKAVPKGQTEAARSLGMSEFDINRTIILPQALRVVVPALVGNVLDIFNTAPLVFIIGLTDFLRSGQMILANPQYGDRVYEVYSFLFVTYFLVGSLITFASRKLEGHLARGTR